MREIVSGLLSWREDPAADGLDREVVVLELNGEIVGVSAHEAVTNDIGQPQPRHRYLMVTAVRADHQRSGLATLLAESVVAGMQSNGAVFVTWLVHPRNLPSIQFDHVDLDLAGGPLRVALAAQRPAALAAAGVAVADAVGAVALSFEATGSSRWTLAGRSRTGKARDPEGSSGTGRDSGGDTKTAADQA